MQITFINLDGETIAHAESEALPRIGERVTLGSAHNRFDRTLYRVADIEWPIVNGPNGIYLQVFVTLKEENEVNNTAKELVEELAARVESGEVVALAAVAVLATGETEQVMAGMDEHTMKGIAALAVLSRDLISSVPNANELVTAEQPKAAR